MSKLTCLVCLQKFSNLPDDNLTSSYQPRLLSSSPTCSGGNLYTRFLLFCTRHLKLTPLPLVNEREDNEVFCPECKCLVSCLCDLWHEMEVVKLHLVWKLEKLGETFKVLGKSSRAEKDLVKQLESDSIRVRRFREEVGNMCQRWMESTPKVVVSNRIIPEMWKFSYSETKSTLARLIFVFALAFDKEPSKERNSSQSSTLKTEANDLPDADNYSEGEDFNEFRDDKDSDYSNPASPSGLDSDSDTEFTPVTPKNRSFTRKRKIKIDQSHPKKLKHSTETIKCYKCPQTFRKSTRLVEHLKLSHNIENPSFKCQICDKLYKTFYSMRLHRKNAHDHPPLNPKRPYRKCKICGECFTLSNLEAHMISTHETDEKLHSCWFCSKLFSLKETLNVHRWNRHNRDYRKMFVCDHINCQQSFQCPDKHEQHLKSHLESVASPDGNQSEAIHHCSKCYLGFFQSDLLIFHELNHLDINCATFNCPKCPDSFTKKQLMVLHYKLSHLPSSVKVPADRKFKCDKCDYSALTKKDIQRHTKMHQDKEPLECDQCGVICHGKRAKQVHLRDEHQINFEEYPCPICGKTFLTSEQVGKHMNGVHREKKFFCDVCGEGFRASYCLRKHKERHHDPNRTAQHICPTCGKTYLTLAGLKYHVNSIHVAEEEKGFGCPFCQKRYHREYLAKVHVKTCMKQRGLEVPDDLDEIEVEWSVAAVKEKVNKGLARKEGKIISGRIMKRSEDGSKSFEKFLY